MANEIALTAAQVEVIHPEYAVIYPFYTVEAVTQGQALYFVAATDDVGIADADDSGKEQFRGIALQAAAAGQVVDLLKTGYVAGFTVSGMSNDDPVYLSNTVGRLSTAVGTMTVNCGRVVAMTDKDRTLVLYVDANWNRIWA